MGHCRFCLCGKPVPKTQSVPRVSNKDVSMLTIFKIRWTHLAEANQLAKLREVRVAWAGRTRTVWVAHGMLSICWSFKLKECLNLNWPSLLLKKQDKKTWEYFNDYCRMTLSQYSINTWTRCSCLQGHPATFFCKTTVQRSKYYLEISKAWEKLKIFG